MAWLAADLPAEGKSVDAGMAGHVARRDAPCCRPGETLDEVHQKVGPQGWSQCPVLDERGIVLGRLRRSMLDGDRSRRVEEVMELGPSTYRPSVPLTEIIDAMKKGGFETTFITTSDGRWVGLLNREDAEEFLRHNSSPREGGRRAREGAQGDSAAATG
jgi:CBS domain-containing protein